MEITGTVNVESEQGLYFDVMPTDPADQAGWPTTGGSTLTLVNSNSELIIGPTGNVTLGAGVSNNPSKLDNNGIITVEEPDEGTTTT